MIRRILAAALLASSLAAGAAGSETDVPAAKMPDAVPSSLVERYRQTLEIDPDNLLLRYQFGVALLMGGAAHEAIEEFRLVYPALGDSAEMNYNFGLAHAQVGDLDSALLCFEQAEAAGALQAPEVPLVDAFFNLAVGYLEAGNHPEAVRLFSKVLALEPQRTDIHRILGDIHARSGDTAAALAAFSRYLAVYPDDRITRDYVFALHCNRGLQLIEENRLTEAAEAFSQAATLAPGHPQALYYLGYVDYASGQAAQAAERLLDALPVAGPELRPAIEALLYNCSLALFDQRKLRLALAAVAPLAQDADATVKELVQAGNIHFALKEFAAALDCYRRALALDPGNRAALQNRFAAESGAVGELLSQGESLLQNEDFAGAIAAFERASAIHPDDARLATALRQAREARTTKAAEWFAAARRELPAGVVPALALVHRGLALEASATGKALEAEILASLAAELSRNLAIADRLLAEGELAAARESYARVLELDPANGEAEAGLRRVADRYRQAAAAALRRGDEALAAADFDTARAAYEDALRLDPEGADGRDRLRRLDESLAERSAEAVQAGRRAFAAGRLDEAREHYRQALRYRDDPAVREDLARIEQASAEQWTSLLKTARAARAAGDFKRARALYAQILARPSAQSTARQELADLEREVAATVARELASASLFLEGKKYAEAIAGFRRALELDPASREAQLGLAGSRSRLQEELAHLVADGQVALGRGDLPLAEQRLRAALALDPYQPEAKAALRRLEEIRRSGSRPGDERQLYLQGIEFYTRGRYEEAVAIWEQVLLLAPGHEKARMNIDKARRKVRQIKEFRDG